MKYLCIDYGHKRSGLAVSDPSGSMAFPRKTIQMQGKKKFLAEIISCIEEERIEAIVLGLPLFSDGSDSETTRMVRNMANSLKHNTKLPVFLMEESLSSFEAEGRLKKTGKNSKQIKDLVDQAAAIAILESFLNLEEKDKRLA